MKLKRFKVTDFRSVKDSGWIEVDDVAALIGTNESGKTNLLLPLWKLNPAKGGEINTTADYPRKHYVDFRNAEPQPTFITAIFSLTETMRAELARLTGHEMSSFEEVSVSRRFDEEYVISFPLVPERRSAETKLIETALNSALAQISGNKVLKSEEQLVQTVKECIEKARGLVPSSSECSDAQVSPIIKALQVAGLDGAPKTSTAIPRFRQLVEEVEDVAAELATRHPDQVDKAHDYVLAQLPKFVYYSHYGNLDSEIYLPHVINNLSRTDLGQKEEARARTLKVLFEFVGLEPKEILDLGAESNQNEDQIALTAEQKKKRSILLQSASTKLTQEFREWWKQGDYRFRFEADGNHFRIWVSDDRRPEEVELEGRSAGLQWFLSFYLVFLVESEDEHANAVLLLDEPGHSLHALAQRDLSLFFNGLAEQNQLVYTTHSPFLIDADHLDRAKKVFVAEDGTSKASADLNAAEGADVSVRGAGYAVHAAVGLTISESLLLGCIPVVVEGSSDQHYLTGIKTLLVAAGRIKPGREYVFPPAGGVKGVKPLVSVISARDDELPVVFVDSDKAGHNFAASLKNGLYKGNEGMILEVGSFVAIPEAEIEDLLPQELIVWAVDRWHRTAEKPFEDVVKADESVVPQIESWAVSQGITLEKPGWKVELAKLVKKRLLDRGLDALDPDTLDSWTKMFEALIQAGGK